MEGLPDYGLIDRTEVGRMIFYPRADRSPPPPGAADYPIDVAPGITVGSRFYPADPSFPTILYFHGNGEVVPDYDETAPIYHQAGANLWVADYRGYGASNGSPSFASLVADAHPVLARFHEVLDEGGYSDRRFVMGRSLGSHPAVELAARAPDRLKGLIIESGGANLRRLMRFFGYGEPTGDVAALIERHRAKMAAIRLPTLVIHGEYDELIPVEHAIEFHADLNAEPKELLIIPGAGHNDILWVGLQQYFAAVARFVGGG
ncbi:MAG TPA: alpha/beta fold hydrolase [Dehalococcoidia bacterium]|nr:alpha/beta fold hydrolase [Dehalococcoidia bacterium]